MYPAHSGDGLHWIPYAVDRPAVPYSSDTNNNLIWDARNNRYMLFLRTFTRLDRWFEPEPVYPKGARVRTPGWASSPNFLDWDAPQSIRDPEERFICFHADARDPLGSRDFYTLEVLPYEDGYVGFTSVYHTLFGMIPSGTSLGGPGRCSALVEPRRQAVPASRRQAGVPALRTRGELGCRHDLHGAGAHRESGSG